MAPGHMIPMLDIAKLFSHFGVQTTFISTFGNAPLVETSINHFNSTNSSNPSIKLVLIQFPSAEAGLPVGCENASYLTSIDMLVSFHKAVAMLRQHFDQLLEQLLPDAVFSDYFLPWTLDSAYIVMLFNTWTFAVCAAYNVDHYDPHSRPEESFIVPDLPHPIHILKSQVHNLLKTDPRIMKIMLAADESDEKSYGAVMNSFYELEPDYVDYYRNVCCKM
ncbi:UDP-glucose flavonoid 3-O-glucosyltransferase 7-like [Dioscorea cayenensis subsp. rotundata]|uniref:UDP-glucose flavonoid 3-O-glucosyltransferase 7-like n=1 Tax=Dioscorea cayennensis subsp. rotundata TaxID=55577 RepID=A0AB40CFY7_DIOCR|nr:UDP-glucose flavonoid 3-O-glucosyltransferase 7-like [Dioscorea cayenensis subsp. rotundata]